MDDPFASSGSEAPPPYLGASQPPGISERMQALMSRAEQEIAEQRQLQALVGEVRQSLAQIQEEIRQAAGAHTLEMVRGEVTSLGSEVRSSTTMIGERLEAVVRAVGASAQVMQGVGQQLDRITELLNHQQQQIAGLTAAVAQQRDLVGAIPDGVNARVRAATDELRTEVRDAVGSVAGSVASVGGEVTAVAGEVAAVRGDLGAVRGEVTAVGNDVGDVRQVVAQRGTDLAALRERLDAVAAEVRTDSASSLRALGERIDAAVLALAEALLRPRLGAVPEAAPAAGDDEDVPTTATMTMPVVAPPWAGAAAGDDSPAAEDEAGDEPVEEAAEAPEPTEDAEPAEAPFGEVPAVEPEATGDASRDYADQADEPDATAEPAVADEEPDASPAAVDDAAPEEPEEEHAVEPEAPAAAEDTVQTEDTDETDDTDDDEDFEDDAPSDEVPLDSWPTDAPGAPPGAPSVWGWDGPGAAAPAERRPDPAEEADPGQPEQPEQSDQGEQPDDEAGQREKRRPWWRPGR